MAVSTCAWSATSPMTPFTFNSSFTSSIIIFCFFAALSSLLVSSLFQLSTFIKCHMGLSLEDKGAIQLHKLNDRCSVTNHQWLWKKWCSWSPIMTCISYLHSDVHTDELAAKFVLCAIIHSWYIVVATARTMLLGPAII